MTVENRDLIPQNKPNTKRETFKTGLRAAAAAAAAAILFGRKSPPGVAHANEEQATPRADPEDLPEVEEVQEVKVEDPFLGSKEHAALKESVTDAISDQELREHNIFIYPAQNTDLVVRRGGLLEDTLLQAAYRGAESSKGPKPKVSIVLVDYDYLTLGNLSIAKVPEEFVDQYQDALVKNQEKSPVGMLEGLRTVDSRGDYIIYLAVGGARQPIAGYSHQKIQDLTMENTKTLTPEQIKKADPSIITQPTFLSAGGYVQVNNRRNAGMVLRRLLKKNPQQETDKDRSKNVTATEVEVFTRYNGAWERFEQTGDDSGFPYVFVTKTGLAYM